MRWWERFSRQRRETDLDRELRDHLDLEAEDHTGSGSSPEESRLGAVRAFGNLPLVKDDVREAWGWMWLDRLSQDVRYVIRSLRKAPGFAVVVVLTLALGVGANAAVFSVLDTVLLRPLPFPEADRTVNLAWDAGDYLQSGLSPAQFHFWRERARSLDGMATWQSFLARVGEGGQISGVRALRVSHDFFEVLGYTPTLGRDFTTSEYEPDGPRVAVVSTAMWRERFGGTDGAVRRSLNLNEQRFTVVGVLPETFTFPYLEEPVAVILPLALTVAPDDERRNWPAIAKLRDGFTGENVRAEVVSLTEPFRAAYPNQVYERERGMTLATFGELYAGDAARPLWILMGAVGLVLLIACANVANLFLVRAARCRGELALRVALARIMQEIRIRVDWGPEKMP